LHGGKVSLLDDGFNRNIEKDKQIDKPGAAGLKYAER